MWWVVEGDAGRQRRNKRERETDSLVKDETRRIAGTRKNGHTSLELYSLIIVSSRASVGIPQEIVTGSSVIEYIDYHTCTPYYGRYIHNTSYGTHMCTHLGIA